MLGSKRKTALLGSASAVALLVASGPAAAETTVEISGYLKGDLFVDTNADIGDSFTTSAIPLDDSTGLKSDSQDGTQFRAHAKQSRLRLRTSTDTPLGELRTHMEGDFLGGTGNQDFSNSNAFRLRHAYGSLGPLLVGKTWTNFMSLHSYPGTVDFFGPTGMPFIRQSQLRYTFDATPNTKISVSAENPELSGRAGPTDLDGDGMADISSNLQEARGGISFDQIPDFTGAIHYSAGGNTVRLTGVVRKLDVDDGVPGSGISPDDEIGWGVHASGSAGVLGRDTAMVNFTYGDGIGRYLINGFGQGAFFNTTTSDLETIESWAVVLAYDHVWSDTAHSTVAWGHYEVEDDFQSGVAELEQLDTVHVSYQWSPVPRVNLGLEWIYGRIEVDEKVGGVDDEGTNHRIQFGAQYLF